MADPTVLDKIVTKKWEEIAAAKAIRPLAEVEARMADAPAPRDFFGALAAGGAVKLIAEVKKASPSKGLIRPDFHPVQIAKDYEAAGASCISCLTDESFFQGHLDYLVAIRSEVGLPILRKDFVLDPYQVVEARAAGADAVLLIAECLDDDALKSLHDQICELGMTPLVELYEESNVARVLNIGAKLVGINNRDLRTFEVDLNHTIRLGQQIPDECVLVGESGIFTHDDILLLQKNDVDAVLVGESLMRQDDVQAAVRKLLGGT
ncbi:indole-3-glycerol phosphate synthase TrpC [Bremerella sp. P1]|uniref:indole-3-glycerol phosphate synthase TrpC n=1 Tax=Bremerella sp. P1 TaxID=3026424 RepID=UPI002367B070|nr:indole-3-glycerol phosphate synthase TrpC [Bremerella sp. P1]WDI44357.1 indole-3-glycerol phosphate synthase TrpC [Bremerella sp. P1]